MPETQDTTATPEPVTSPTNSRTLSSLNGALWDDLQADDQEALTGFVKAHWDTIATKI